MKITNSERVVAAIVELENALRDEAINGTFVNNHTSIFILTPDNKGKGTTATTVSIGFDCGSCRAIVAKAAMEKSQQKSADAAVVH